MANARAGKESDYLTALETTWVREQKLIFSDLAKVEGMCPKIQEVLDKGEVLESINVLCDIEKSLLKMDLNVEAMKKFAEAKMAEMQLPQNIKDEFNARQAAWTSEYKNKKKLVDNVAEQLIQRAKVLQAQRVETLFATLTQGLNEAHAKTDVILIKAEEFIKKCEQQPDQSQLQGLTQVHA